MRISATLIDRWLAFQREEYVTEADLIASIKGEFHPSRKMQCGSAFDQILQDPKLYLKGDSYVCDGIAFPAKEMDSHCIPLFQMPGVWQVKDTRLVTLEDGTPVTVVSKVDRLTGNIVEEVKTYWTTFDYERYAEAHQWRHYALTFKVPTVRYSCFGWTETSKGELRLNEVHRFALHSYPGMEQDCMEPLEELCAFITRRGLAGYVADKAEPERSAA